jgi:hypothetical protein
MKIKLQKANFGCYLLKAENGKELLIQTDWDFPSTALSFGYCCCECGETDGTVDCIHKTATQMITEARDYLDEHIGDIIDDVGYFED